MNLSFFATSQNLYAELQTYNESAPEHKTEVAQSLVRSFAQRDRIPTLTADELETIVSDALDEDYFDKWLFQYEHKTAEEQAEIMFQDKRMVWYTIRLTADEELREQAVDALETLGAIEVDLA